MGRSYSFDAFHSQQPALSVQGSAPRLGDNEDQARLTQQSAEQPETPATLRQPNSETVKRYRQRAAQRATASKASTGSAKGKPKAKASSASAKGKQAASGTAPARVKRTAPKASRGVGARAKAPASRKK